MADSISKTRNSGATVARRSTGQKISMSAASARLLWQVALRFITLTQLQQVRCLSHYAADNCYTLQQA